MTRRAGLAALLGLGAGAVGVASVRVGVDLVSLVVLLVGGLIVVTAGVLALRRFAALVLLLLVVRPELDAVGHGSASAIGLIFIGACLWWLWSQWTRDSLVPPSDAVWALLGLVGASALSTLGSHVPTLSATTATRLAAGVLMFVVVEQLVRTRVLTASTVHRALAASAVIVCVHVLVQVVTGTSPHGQGHETAWSQIVADRLGLDVSRVKLRQGDQRPDLQRQPAVKRRRQAEPRRQPACGKVGHDARDLIK